MKALLPRGEKAMASEPDAASSVHAAVQAASEAVGHIAENVGRIDVEVLNRHSDDFLRALTVCAAPAPLHRPCVMTVVPLRRRHVTS